MAPDSPPATALPSRRGWVCLGLFLATALLFSRAVPHAFLDYDDPDYVTGNAAVQAGPTLAGLRWALTTGTAANWHPLTWVSHMVDWRLFGARPAGHHAVSVLWHALNAALAFLALRRLTGDFWTSALSAALFAWHPLRAESVAWVAERKDVLSTGFALATLWAYAGYARGGGRRAYGLALGAFALGLLCKPMLVTLPFVLLLLDGWPLRRLGRGGAALLLEKLPFLLLAAASSAATYLVQKHGGAVADAFPLGARLGNAAVSVARYLGMFFWPFGLAVGYPHPARWPAAAVAGSALLLAAVTAAALAQWRRRPWIAVGWLWFLGMLVPVLGLVQVGLAAMADRYTYLPSLGLQLALLWTARDLLPAAGRRLAPWAAAALLAGLAARTWNQLGVWSDSVTLYRHALAVTRNNYLAECYLGTALLNGRQLAAAEPHLRRAAELRPDFGPASTRLGYLLEQEGHPDQAAACYAALLRLKPNFAEANFDYGRLLLRQNRPAEALPRLQAAERSRPDAETCDELGSALEQLGRTDEAMASYAEETRLQPGSGRGEYNRGVLRLARGDAAGAEADFRAAAARDPGFAPPHVGLGQIAEQAGARAEAIAEYRRALELNPEDEGVRALLQQAQRP
ncbi:MAG TPA: tetratricopeptide repeat protein [Opitutaceae bacterium]|nr:tetratricopeptide repeat protein [Opitutaceae bacterium]